MNIFFLNIDPKKCAIESLPEDAYRSFNPKHPTCIWVRLGVQNYLYCAQLAMYLYEEYTFRYNKIHSGDPHIK